MQLAAHPLVSLSVALLAGAAGLRWCACPCDHPLMQLLGLKAEVVFATIYWTWTTLLFTTPWLAWQLLVSVTYIFTSRRRSAANHGLPPYPAPAVRSELVLILGELHHPHRVGPSPTPRWLTIPEKGLCTGIAIVGAIGTGKTSACMSPYAWQVLGCRAGDPAHRVGGLVLEVKGDFCHQVRSLLREHGREHDYVEVGIGGPCRYNPLHNDLDAYALAYGIASLMTNLYGRGKEPFWQQASTNLVKFVILLHKVLDDYVTLFDVYECTIDPDRLAEKLADGEQRFGTGGLLAISKADYLAADQLATIPWTPDPTGTRLVARHTPELEALLTQLRIAHQAGHRPDALDPTLDRKRAEFEAVKRWFHHDWMRIDTKLRTSIVEGVSVFLSLFDDNPLVKETFCPPKACYDPIANADGRYGRPLPPFPDLIEHGRVCALNFPVAANPGLARAIGTMMKMDFQRAVLGRIPRMAAEPSRSWRHVLFLCDEYQAFATVGESDPSGDEKFFALSRQARCIPIVATQSLSSLRSTLPGEAWRTLFQTFRTKIFLALSDDFSARIASDLCGKAEQLKPHYSLTENGQDARVSMLTGRATANRATVSASKSYHLQRDYVFEAKTFMELRNSQAIVLAYDGVNPLPPTLCYLKPHYLDPNRTYFEHVAAGVL